MPIKTKVAAGALAGALSTLAVWIIGRYIVVPAEIAVALSTVVSFAVSWLVPESS